MRHAVTRAQGTVAELYNEATAAKGRKQEL
jgi:hypothetical protein